ncbi:sporulation histidine kinase inhibitor Sda [Allobacillus sp. SKP2-8]|nr:sporulation histidine kinase inhibitor Sda [Allobacillus sp. SKP2-8]TSJ68276.1 sporulation histidine kinase inhibitor Sda [Allobacillus sp. SKP2-8]
MEQLSDHLLIESYYRAIKLDLNDDFISLIERELIIRGLDEKIKEMS